MAAEFNVLRATAPLLYHAVAGAMGLQKAELEVELATISNDLTTRIYLAGPHPFPTWRLVWSSVPETNHCSSDEPMSLCGTPTQPQPSLHLERHLRSSEAYGRVLHETAQYLRLHGEQEVGKQGRRQICPGDEQGAACELLPDTN